MNEHQSQEFVREVRLDPQQQQAVLMLASRLQQEENDTATLEDLIKIGEEAGISRQSVETAFAQIIAQPSEKQMRREFEAAVRGEISALAVTLTWLSITWMVIRFGSPERFGELVGFGSMFAMPVILGLLVRRIWLAGVLSLVVMLSLVTAILTQFGSPEGGVANELPLFLVPVALAIATSLISRRKQIADILVRRRSAQTHSKTR
jgi:hypothetical protein